MPADAPRNPFSPGPGTWPPVLAGREAEQAQLLKILADLGAGCASPIHLLQAPRGMGKTVLLRDLQQIAQARVRWMTGADLFDLPCLVRELASPAGRLKLGISGASLSGLGVQRRPPDPSWWRQKLKSQLQGHRKPLLLLIDEAHVLPADVAHVLLNMVQALAASGSAKVALLLSGTPRLKPFLLSEAVNASFIERAPLIIPGLLSEEASREALDAPDWRGWRKDQAVLDEAAADSQGYPYFVQLWGHALWDAGQVRQHLDQAALAEARSRMEAVRNDFYSDRYDEFETSANGNGIPRDAMLAAVRAIAPQVRLPGAAISTAQLNRALGQSGMDPDAVNLAKDIIVGNGFLTKSGDHWRAAIPSFADYVLRHPR